jgi:hypothetical protein
MSMYEVLIMGYSANEKETGNEILSFVQNLEDEAEALEFARLYLKAINASRVAITDDFIDENAVYQYMREVDARF